MLDSLFLINLIAIISARTQIHQVKLILILLGSSIQYSSNSNHWYVLRDPKRIVFLAWVKFSCAKDLTTCDMCTEAKADMLYCHNDEKYFCGVCDEDFHNKHTVLKKHKRTNYSSFSITYPGMCYQHTLKPYEFYCSKCRAVYCIRCLTEGEHKANTDHDVKYLNDVYNNFDQEIKTVN